MRKGQFPASLNSMLVFWNVPEIARLMEREGLANANHLHAFAGLTIATAYNVVSGGALERIHIPTWRALVQAFGVTDPLTLIDIVLD